MSKFKKGQELPPPPADEIIQEKSEVIPENDHLPPTCAQVAEQRASPSQAFSSSHLSSLPPRKQKSRNKCQQMEKKFRKLTKHYSSHVIAFFLGYSVRYFAR